MINISKEEIEKRKIFEKVSETFFKNTIYPIAILDRNYNFVRVNDAYAKIYSRDVSCFPGSNHFKFYPYPSDAKEIFDNVVKTKEVYKASAKPFTYPGYTEWGLTYWDFSVTPVLDSSGGVDLLILTLSDVTKHIRVQKKLVESEERYPAIFNNSQEGKVSNDLRLSEKNLYKAFHHNQIPMAILRLNSSVFIDVNSSYADMLGYNREWLIGKSSFELNVWVDLKDRQKILKHIREHGYIRNFESEFRKKTGDIGCCLSTLSVLEKIGTPFFTTKENGTGLGLAICYSIAHRHNAKIDIETGSTGTTFYVRFSV